MKSDKEIRKEWEMKIKRAEQWDTDGFRSMDDELDVTA
jgi:hypothetical protein